MLTTASSQHKQCPRWNLRPTTQKTSPYKQKDGDGNGSCVYQAILNSMQILPVTDIVQITHSQSGEKRKPHNAPTTQSRKKGKAPTNKAKKNIDITMDTS
jgi:hypothetical protein